MKEACIYLILFKACVHTLLITYLNTWKYEYFFMNNTFPLKPKSN